MSTSATLVDYLPRLAGRRVLVVGDAMLDEYVWGEVRRISPEAPVPVVESRGRSYRSGGAGNVCANIAALGGVPLLGCVVGDDPMAAALAAALDEAGVLTRNLLRASDRPTTVKSRIVAHSQQMLRVDTEVVAPIDKPTQALLVAWCEAELANVELLVLSDYAKGVLVAPLCRALIAAARARSVPVVVDPKGSDFAKYAGATVVTPNTREAAVASGASSDAAFDLYGGVATLQRVLGGAALLLTRGAAGMALFQRGVPPLHIAALARTVYDVTGAGDTVVAALALALASGVPLGDAAQLANVAAGVVVGKVGTATASLAELRDAL